MFKITRGTGFQMTFENGWTISVQFGYANYCDNNRHPDGFDFGKNLDIVQSSDAEIAIWNSEGSWHTFEDGDTVKGYCSADEVATWIEFTKNQK